MFIMQDLTPPLSVIESNLNEPPFDLIARWIDQDSTLSSADRAALDANPSARALRETWRIECDESAPEPPLPAVPLPAHLAEKIRQRVATAEARRTTAPRPGLILGVRVPITAQTQARFHTFAVVLLSEPSEIPDVWRGWLMAAETDYATDRDILLEAEDEPYDPIAAMVQTWNPVRLMTTPDSIYLGELSSGRLQAVAALARDVVADAADAGNAAPGALVTRLTSAGQRVLTGTPLGDPHDPRRGYRLLYHEVARRMCEATDKLTRPAASRVSGTSWADRLIDELKAAAGRAGYPLSPVPVGALTADTALLTHRGPHRLGDRLQINLIPTSENDAVQIHLTLLDQGSLTATLSRGERIRQRAYLTPTAAEADLFAGADQSLTLSILESTGELLLALPLPRAADAGD